ncbi:Deoxyuridine 5'-triphosphate nucleotidohydrolase [Buchnera aphidicola (Periphyllus testudinaceus)]|uniref:dUTP diphosphatase n=1 Tax=Buchnera aphidicola TaxID=9 RepID=UPI0034643319
MKIDIKILNKNLKKKKFFPKYSTTGSAGIDLRACISKKINIKKNESFLFSTGISIYINSLTLSAFIIPRSGLGHKNGIILGNSVGLIDSDYQGEIMVSLWNRSNKLYCVNPYDRIAQIVFVPIKKVTFNVVKNFSEKSERGIFGFGHTGKN